MWRLPLDKQLIGTTLDVMSFQNIDIATQLELPILPHTGAFGAVRKYHCHEGIDFYCNPNDYVYAVENGTVVDISPFTGEHAECPWWNNTWAVLVEGESGLICYGEISPASDLNIGDNISQGALIGEVLTVLKTDKGRPMTMLHLELRKSGCIAHPEWVGDDCPYGLLDPTPYLMHLIMKG